MGIRLQPILGLDFSQREDGIVKSNNMQSRRWHPERVTDVLQNAQQDDYAIVGHQTSRRQYSFQQHCSQSSGTWGST